MADATPATNAPEWTVSELAGALRRTLEDRFGHVRIRGELGKVNRHGSGHVYLDLKDEGACIAGVIWRNTAQRLKVRLEQGMEVVATGRITTFPGQSKYQIVIDSIEPAGVGALMAVIEERRRRLAGEGLFDASRKRPLPFLPGLIGIVTSPTGAVIRDVLHRLDDRFPRPVLLWPVRVQGETCGPEVAAAIVGLNALPERGVPRPDLIIVARGGGSLEDLWGFNDEAVVRAAAASAIPLISAIGHETDWTLLDHVADVRAPTPTGAAEMAVPVRADLQGQADDFGRRLGGSLRRGLDARRTELRSAVRGLPGPDALLAERRQGLDLAAARLGPALLANARAGERRLGQLGARLAARGPAVSLARARERLDATAARHAAAGRRKLADAASRLAASGPRLAIGLSGVARAERQRLDGSRERLSNLGERLDRATLGGIERARLRFEGQISLLGSLGYRAVLERGFALVRDRDGRPVVRAEGVGPGRPLILTFADGERSVLATGAGAEGARPRRRPPSPLVQESLFDM